MIKILRRIPLLSQLKVRDLRAIQKIARIRECEKGESIFSKSESANCLFIVLSGKVKIFTHWGGRKRKTFSYLESGDFFGEMAVVEGKTRSAAAQALSPCRLLIIAKTDFKRLLLNDPNLTFFLLRTMCERLRRTNEEVEDLLFRNLLARAAKAIWSLSQKGKKLNKGRILDRPYTQQELADIIGTTREPLARALASLRRAGLIEERSHRLFLHDPERMASLFPSF